MTGGLATGWLEDHVRTTGLPVLTCVADEIDAEAVFAYRPDWVVVDSYRLPAASASRLGRSVRVLAIVDGDHRGIEAALYLDQNLGAESIWRPEDIRDRFICGATFALVRQAILDARRPEPWRAVGDPPTVLTFMGGTDATGANLSVAESLASIDEACALTMVAPVDQHRSLHTILEGRAGVRLVEPTPSLPTMMGEADVIVSATGTSAWDICTLGVPAVLVAVADNQHASLSEAISRGFVLGIDYVDPAEVVRSCGPLVAGLLRKPDLRRSLSDTCLALYDGEGARRVIEVMETQLHAGREEGVRP
jgi:spore coat polysaccharide biosynthesis predicted glycosyltransferase SpsG